MPPNSLAYEPHDGLERSKAPSDSDEQSSLRSSREGGPRRRRGSVSLQTSTCSRCALLQRRIVYLEKLLKSTIVCDICGGRFISLAGLASHRLNKHKQPSAIAKAGQWRRRQQQQHHRLKGDHSHGKNAQEEEEEEENPNQDTEVRTVRKSASGLNANRPHSRRTTVRQRTASSPNGGKSSPSRRSFGESASDYSSAQTESKSDLSDEIGDVEDMETSFELILSADDYSPLVRSAFSGQAHNGRGDRPRSANRAFRDGKFHCTYCPESFYQEKHVWRHVSLAHDFGPYSCRYCEIRFEVRRHQRRHERTCQRNDTSSASNTSLNTSSEQSDDKSVSQAESTSSDHQSPVQEADGATCMSQDVEDQRDQRTDNDLKSLKRSVQPQHTKRKLAVQSNANEKLGYSSTHVSKLIRGRFAGKINQIARKPMQHREHYDGNLGMLFSIGLNDKSVVLRDIVRELPYQFRGLSQRDAAFPKSLQHLTNLLGSGHVIPVGGLLDTNQVQPENSLVRIEATYETLLHIKQQNREISMRRDSTSDEHAQTSLRVSADGTQSSQPVEAASAVTSVKHASSLKRQRSKTTTTTSSQNDVNQSTAAMSSIDSDQMVAGTASSDPECPGASAAKYRLVESNSQIHPPCNEIHKSDHMLSDPRQESTREVPALHPAVMDIKEEPLDEVPTVVEPAFQPAASLPAAAQVIALRPITTMRVFVLGNGSLARISSALRIVLGVYRQAEPTILPLEVTRAFVEGGDIRTAVGLGIRWLHSCPPGPRVVLFMPSLDIVDIRRGHQLPIQIRECAEVLLCECRARQAKLMLCSVPDAPPTASPMLHHYCSMINSVFAGLATQFGCMYAHINGPP